MRHAILLLLLTALPALAGCAQPAADDVEAAAADATGPSAPATNVTKSAEGDWTLATPEASFVGSGNPELEAPKQFASATATLTWAWEGPEQAWTLIISSDGETMLEEEVTTSPHTIELERDDERIAGGGFVFLRPSSAAARVTFLLEATFAPPAEA